MAKGSFPFIISLSLLLPLFLSFLSLAHGRNHTQKPFSAIFVFGDSTVDPGNNNYIPTIFKSNFPPYGRDFFNHIPTGRFTNGRLATDFVASYVGLKDAIPAYLDPGVSLEQLMTGVSFASAASGYDPLTPKITNVIDLPKQLQYFQEFKQKLVAAIGKERTDDQIRRAVVLISAGTNDFVISYFGLGLRSKDGKFNFSPRRETYTVEEYQQFILQNFREFFQGLWELGARKFAVMGLPPMGCLPIVITINPSLPLSQRRCIDKFNVAAQGYNQKLQDEITAIQKRYGSEGGRFIYGDIYTPLTEMAMNASKFGFDHATNGCCGTGLFEVSIFFCTPTAPVCPDASKYVYFDSIHPTEKAYNVLFKSLQDKVGILAR